MTYKVMVKVLAEVEYEVTVEAASEAKAEMKAEAIWRENLPEDFQVDKGYITGMETEAEQLTWECESCGDQITEKQSDTQDEMCEPCFEVQKAKDAAFWQWINVDKAAIGIRI